MDCREGPGEGESMVLAIMACLAACGVLVVCRTVTIGRAARRVASAGAEVESRISHIRVAVDDVVINLCGGLAVGVLMQISFISSIKWRAQPLAPWVELARMLLWIAALMCISRLATRTFESVSQGNAARRWIFLGWMLPLLAGIVISVSVMICRHS
jgi:hypothetical protein